MIKKSFLSISIILAFLVLPNILIAAENEKDTIIEITDRYKEVKLGITETSIYMIIDERIRSIVNSELRHQYEKDIEDFNDSEGNFIPGVYSFLSSNIIEIPLSDIQDLEFRNGSLRFNYSTNVSFQLEDVISLNGNKVLDNFFVEDLESFYITAMQS